MYAKATYGDIGEGCCGAPRDLRDQWRQWYASFARMSESAPPRGGHHRGPRGRGGGPGGFEGFPFWALGSWGRGPGGRFGRGRKARRGDIRTAVLLLLAEEPRNGYQIMQEVQERSGGVWSPSPGSVYPALAQLEDEGLIRSRTDAGGTGRVFELTDAGREQVDARGADAPAPWDLINQEVGEPALELAGAMRDVAHAFTQVVRTGSPAQIEAARDLLVQLRRDLYRLLADGDPQAGDREE